MPSHSQSVVGANGIAADYQVTLSEMGEVVSEFAKARETPMFWGPPGIGKSAVAMQAAADIGYQMHDTRLGQLESIDLRGLPAVEHPWEVAMRRVAQSDGIDGLSIPKMLLRFLGALGESRGKPVTTWAAPDFLPPEDSTDGHLLFLDELSSAPPSVQAAAYQLIQDRGIGEYRLPEGAAIIAAGNRESDRGLVHQMLSPLASRFVHFDVDVPRKQVGDDRVSDSSEWVRWATGANLAPEVIFFMDLKPELLMDFNPRTWDGRGFPCPREWHKVSNIVQRMSLSDTVRRAAVRGAVGQAAAVEFLAFMDVWQEIPPPELILNDPHSAPIPSNVSALVALCGALYKTGKVDSSNFESVTTYAGREDMREEVGEFLVGRCVQLDPKLIYTMAWKKWEIAHQ